MNKKIKTTLGLILAIFTLVLVGCGGTMEEESSLPEMSTTQEEAVSDSGVLVLRINPEIAIEYDQEGIVTDVAGRNNEGSEVVENYQDFSGKNSGVVLEELVSLIGEAGYFVEEVEGESRRVVLELESGSVLPEEEFLEEMTANVQTAASQFNADANATTDEANAEHTAQTDEQRNQEEQDNQDNQDPEEITMERAQEIALQHAGKNAADVRWDDLEFDVDDGVPHFEIEFDVGPNEYEYVIHAETGKIMEYDHELKTAPNKADTKDQVPAEKQPTATQEISRDEAIEIALNHASLNRSEVDFDDVELEYEDGRKEWEVDFDHGNWEYEYDIDAQSGDILDFEREHDD